MAPPFRIPEDVLWWIRSAFEDCNNHVAQKLSHMPATYETSLDMALIEQLSRVPTPTRVPSGWIVSLSTHYLGGGRHYGEWVDWPRRWEIADIGLLIQFRQAGTVVRSKIALLQSKRLYANELQWEELTPLDYAMGFGRLFSDDTSWDAIATPRRFTFTHESSYSALHVGDHQFHAIETYETQKSIPVHYLLYNPTTMPLVRDVPMVTDTATVANEVGCRVFPARTLRPSFAHVTQGSAPRYRDLPAAATLPHLAGDNHPGWKLEEFVVDLVVQCHEGHVANNRADAGLQYIFTRRTSPIAAALSMTIDAPDGVELLT